MLRLLCSLISTVAVIGFILAGCGGGNSKSASDDTDEKAPDSTTNTLPTVTGNTLPAVTGNTSTTTSSTGLTNTTSTPRVVCGDGVKGGSEECDGTDFGGESCASLVTDSSGKLSCNSDCTINESMCSLDDGLNVDSGYGSDQ